MTYIKDVDCKSCENYLLCSGSISGKVCKNYALYEPKTGDMYGDRNDSGLFIYDGVTFENADGTGKVTEDDARMVMEACLQFLPPHKLGEPLVEPYDGADRYDYVMTPDVNMPRKCMTCVHNLGKYGPMDNCLADIKPGEDIDMGKVRRVNKKHACLQWKPADKITERAIHNVSLLVF
jgi:hypothetical protein